MPKLVFSTAMLFIAFTTVARAHMEETKILEFNNPDGAKQYTDGCHLQKDGVPRIKVDVDKVERALLGDGCIEFFVKGEKDPYWIKETAVSHSGAKSSNKNYCERVAAAQGSGSTVEAATMGYGGSDSSRCRVK